MITILLFTSVVSFMFFLVFGIVREHKGYYRGVPVTYRAALSPRTALVMVVISGLAGLAALGVYLVRIGAP